MHQRTAGKAETILHQIEPALAGKKIANLDKTHAIVIVGTDIVGGAEEFGNKNDGGKDDAIGDDDRPETRQQRPESAPLGGSHGQCIGDRLHGIHRG